MTRAKARRIRSAARDQAGAAMVEFALITPVFLMMLIGVFQMAFWMQNHNAMRSIASDTARYVAVEYQNGNTLPTSNIEAVTRSIAVRSPYGLENGNFDVTVTQSASSRVTGATELKVDMSYQAIDILPFVPLDPLTFSYSRPVFVFGTPSPNPPPTV